MNVEIFARQVRSLQKRLTELYQEAIAIDPQTDSLLPVAFKELGMASETLEVATAKLLEQTEELAIARAQAEAERQRYQDLFEFMPDAYIVSDPQGKIQEANCAATNLFNVEQGFLSNKLLVSFIPLPDRPAFRAQLSQLIECHRVQEWTVHMQPRNQQAFDAAVIVTPVRDVEGKLISLRWIVRNITKRHQTQLTVLNPNDELHQDHRAKHVYAKGEVIPLEPQTICLVRQGLVKLSTMSETGDEVVVGLAGRSMPFGSGMTALPTYQATALSENVQLVYIPLEEIVASPALTQALLPQISKRIRQTELLLAIAGKRHVKDRLYSFLLWLKQEFGQKVGQGTRLTVRLTHQDLADACCTTRVTITRELSKLQQQGKIMLDSKHHIIFLSTLSKQAA